MATQKHLEILLSGVDKWNHWRHLHPKVKPNLTDSDLSNLKLGGGNFNDVDFRGSKIFNSSFYKADFERANLSGLSLRKKNFFEKADFKSANMTKVDSRSANFFKVNFSGTNFSDAWIENAFVTTYESIIGATFKNARINRVVFSDNIIQDCDFSGAKLTSVSFEGPDCQNNKFICATLKNVSFSNCDLEGSSYSGAEIRDANFEGSKLKSTDFQQTRLKNINFNNSDIRQSYFTEAKTIQSKKLEKGKTAISFDNANFYECDISRSKLFNGSFIKTNFNDITGNNSDFRQGNFTESKIFNSEFKNSIFRDSDFSYVTLRKTDFISSDFYRCKFPYAELVESNFTNAELSGSDMTFANLQKLNLTNSKVNGVEFYGAILLGLIIEGTILSHSRIYGVSVWGSIGEPKEQIDLIITPSNEQEVTIDNIEIAQFIHLLLTSDKLKHIIDTITSKVVLILGRFNERKIVLDSIKDQLRKMGLTPIIFDFTKPGSRNLTETIGLLARLSKFIIADISEAKSVPHELYSFVPHCPSIPTYPIFETNKNKIETPYALSADFKQYPWVSKIILYEKIEDVTKLLPEIHEDAINRINRQKI